MDSKPTRLSPEIAYEQRTELVRQMLAKESAELDARTARLKALRLARDAELAAQAAAEPQAPAKPAAKRSARRKH